MPIRKLVVSLSALTVLACGALAQSPSPAPSPSARAEEEVPENYRKLLATLRTRREDELPPADPRFGRPDAPDISTVRVKEIRPSPKGLALILEDDPKEYHVNDIINGRRLVSVSADEATFDFRGEQRRIKIRRVAPTLQVRAIKQVEGEWAAFLEGERRPLYPGDVVRGARIVKVEADGVTFQMGTEVRKLGPKALPKPFWLCYTPPPTGDFLTDVRSWRNW